jgi:hypothetical protein
MEKARIAVLVALIAPGCAADTEPENTADLPAVAARIVALSPGANYVAGFDVRQIRRDPAVREAASDGTGMGWSAWAAQAAMLQLDPFADASSVAVAASIGSCGVTRNFVLAVPAADASTFAIRVDEAIRVWREKHPPPCDDDARPPTDPASSGWVQVADGACTVVRVGEYEELGVTLRKDGSLFLHRTPFGDACTAEGDLPPEVTEATWLAGAALAQGWEVGAGGETPAVIEAMPGEAKVTWLGAGASP